MKTKAWLDRLDKVVQAYKTLHKNGNFSEEEDNDLDEETWAEDFLYFEGTFIQKENQ